MFLKSHSYMINLDNVQYCRRVNLKGKEDAVGTFFRMNNGRSLIIRCPFEAVYTQVKNKRGMNTMNTEVCVLSYKADKDAVEILPGTDIVDRLHRIEAEENGANYDPR